MCDFQPDARSLAQNQFMRDVIDGLSRKTKALPGKYLWDEAGSILFDRICQTQDYYLTRRETALLARAAPEVASYIGSHASLIEYGSGASRKVRILLDALAAPRRYVAIDISREYLDAAARRIAADYPSLEVLPVAADYTAPITLAPEIRHEPTLGFFPGSTIGNFDSDDVVAFLERARATLQGGWFLIGHDPNQEAATLQKAYGEAEGLMAALHLNLLSHINEALGADFDPANFRHEVRIERDPPRVEAYLTAVRPASYRIQDQVFAFAEGESIHTDTSYKMEATTFQALAARAGWRSERLWLDSDGLYALHLLRAG